MFGIVGLYMLVSAIIKINYLSAVMIGIISMVSFIILYFQIGKINNQLKKVMIIDVIASVVLIFVSVLYFVF